MSKQRILKHYRLDENVAIQLSVEAAKRRIWPNKIIESALNEWFKKNCEGPQNNYAREQPVN